VGGVKKRDLGVDIQKKPIKLKKKELPKGATPGVGGGNTILNKD